MGQVDLGGGRNELFFGKAGDRATELVVNSERVHGSHARAASKHSLPNGITGIPYTMVLIPLYARSLLQ